MTDELVDQLPIRYRWLLAESQAREVALREALEIHARWGTGQGPKIEAAIKALALPHDGTALKEYRKQVLLEAADMIKQQDVDPSFKFRMIDAIRRMTKE